MDWIAEKSALTLEQTGGLTVVVQDNSSIHHGTGSAKAKDDPKKKLCTQQSEKPSGYSSCESSIGMRLGK
jgi:hypothetical protein